MKNLIITADDFGVFPAINEGVFEAVEAGKINSVATFANFDGREASGDNPKINSSVENAKELHNRYGDNVEIGCHLTITSGKPVTGLAMQFIGDGHGYFSDFTEFSHFNLPEQLAALETELCEQVKRLEDGTDIKVKHLTNHHNSLCFFPEHFEVYIKVARKFKIPMRSVNIQPERENNLYIKHVYRKLRDDVTKEERELMLRFSEEVTDFLKTTGSDIKTPDMLNSTHYGPIGFYPNWFVNIFKNIFAWNKNRQLENILDDFMKGGKHRHLELMLHLGKNENRHITEFVSGLYPGVAPNYFDSRAAELKSILKYEFEKHPEINRHGWKAL